MIKIENVSIKYIKEYYSLYNVSLEINENTLLIGNETSGNNFLLRILSKIDKHYQGKIYFENHDLVQIKDRDLSLAFIPQKPCLFENKSILENLIYPLKIRKINKKEAILRAKTAISPYFLKIFENFNAIQNNKSASNEKTNSNFKANENNKSYNDDYIKNNNQDKLENDFENFLKIKVKKLSLSAKKIIALLRAKIREPKYISIENFFENLDAPYFDLANEIVLDLKSKSTIIASQNGVLNAPSYEGFKQVFFDAGSIVQMQ